MNGERTEDRFRASLSVLADSMVNAGGDGWGSSARLFVLSLVEAEEAARLMDVRTPALTAPVGAATSTESATLMVRARLAAELPTATPQGLAKVAFRVGRAEGEVAAGVVFETDVARGVGGLLHSLSSAGAMRARTAVVCGSDGSTVIRTKFEGQHAIYALFEDSCDGSVSLALSVLRYMTHAPRTEHSAQLLTPYGLRCRCEVVIAAGLVQEMIGSGARPAGIEPETLAALDSELDLKLMKAAVSDCMLGALYRVGEPDSWPSIGDMVGAVVPPIYRDEPMFFWMELLRLLPADAVLLESVAAISALGHPGLAGLADQWERAIRNSERPEGWF